MKRTVFNLIIDLRELVKKNSNKPAIQKTGPTNQIYLFLSYELRYRGIEPVQMSKNRVRDIVRKIPGSVSLRQITRYYHTQSALTDYQPSALMIF